MVYEMSFNVSGMDMENTTIEVVTAHNSPSKDGDSEVVISPEIIPEMKDIIIPIFFVTAIFIIYRKRKKVSANTCCNQESIK